jgi:hypothetical protein
MRRAAALASLLLFQVSVALAQSPAPPDNAPRPLRIEAQPIVSFSPGEPERTRFGAFEFLGGLVLESDDKRFGGLSGLRFLSDDEFLAINDRGRWLRARLALDGKRPRSIEQATMAPMLDGNGVPLHEGNSLDTESIALAENGDVLVGIERVHRILRYDFGKRGFASRARNVELPAYARDLPRNAGIEGLIYVPRDRPLGGTIIAFTERALDKSGNLRGFLIGGPSPGEFTIRRSNDYDITDAALIPGGDVLILERYYSWLGALKMRIRKIPLADIKPGALVDGPMLIEASGAQEIDNMEGIDVQRGAGGETLVTVISDDNFFGLQRTLLLRFALAEDQAD